MADRASSLIAPWHALDADSARQQLGCDTTFGLCSQTVAQRPSMAFRHFGGTQHYFVDRQV